ncbi:MAG: hypothetical protein QGG36_27685 [Pirellulaceae bacterium]|jgi:hypothetical protein|nr:hypothetical protein [Pirellulaceae bacterium]MDP7019610.1 hypothetical protein [Pirellulaceae bacterium]
MRELVDVDDARDYIEQSLTLSRTSPADSSARRHALLWVQEAVSVGAESPPIGFVADIGNIAIGRETAGMLNARPPDRWNPAQIRLYDDYVLGKIYADPSFQRAADAVAKYQGRQREQAIAYLVERICVRAGIDGVQFSPAVIKALLKDDARAVDLPNDLRDDLEDDVDRLIEQMRHVGELLGVADIIELERGTALDGFGQRVALRQILVQMADFLRSTPTRRIRPEHKRSDVATPISDEDLYPVGGFSSISNRGSVESLLHSQLAYMERDDDRRPDLFDIKFLRDELLYYSRDDNQFHRRRQSFFILLDDSLTSARFKDAELPFQRLVVLLAGLATIVRKLIEWLSDEALRFEFVVSPRAVLNDEVRLLEIVFADQIENGTVAISADEVDVVASRCAVELRRGHAHVLRCAGDASRPDRVETATTSSVLNLVGPTPQLAIDELTERPEEVDLQPLDAWHWCLRKILSHWVS